MDDQQLQNDESGQAELQQLLEQAFRKGVADGKKRELRRVFDNFGFTPPVERSRLRDMRALFDDNVKYALQTSSSGGNGTRSLGFGKYGSFTLGGESNAAAADGGMGEPGGSFRGGTYDSRTVPRRRSPPPPGTMESGTGDSASRFGVEQGNNVGDYGSGVPPSYQDGGTAGTEQGGAYGSNENGNGQLVDVSRAREGLTMPRNLKRGGDIRVVKQFGLGRGKRGEAVYDSDGRVVGRRGEYDSRGRRKPDKSHVTMDFKVHLSPKDGRLLAKVVGDKNKDKDRRGRRRRGGRNTNEEAGEDSDDSAQEKDDKMGGKAKLAMKFLTPFIKKQLGR